MVLVVEELTSLRRPSDTARVVKETLAEVWLNEVTGEDDVVVDITSAVIELAGCLLAPSVVS